ncbi:DNA-binding transcriptional MerR regulator [Nonomuraea polychroma]|uniref:DNA-binding transcriptional MerR regulator n=1 Tax=Nonomuraea polychroma TaxID=46176 RepID=A0A438M6S5_9ACTN|nr:MerR family transcriptional regulator [Nonomuraea polychroma]RVX41398.1 DNA-binding transcriptional MerR regulator [Nonomuraea polychroma]
MDTSADAAAPDDAPAAPGGGGDHLHIGQVAARTGLSLRTIRHYDEVSLVRPSARSRGGFRLYTEADVARLMVIRRMKPLGFTLEEMGELLAITDRLVTDRLDQAGPAAGRTPLGALGAAERADLRARLERFEQAAQERCAALRIQLNRAEEFAAELHQHAINLAADDPCVQEDPSR